MYKLTLEILFDERYEVLLDLQDKLQQVIHLYPCAIRNSVATDHVGDVSPIQGNHGIASAPRHASQFARDLQQFTGDIDELDYKVAEILKKHGHHFELEKPDDFLSKEEMKI